MIKSGYLIRTFGTLLVLLLAVQLYAADLNRDGIQDDSAALVDANNDGYHDTIGFHSPATAAGKDILIVHETSPMVFFGWYRMSMMSAPGWDLYQRSLYWLTGWADPVDVHVILFTYNGTLDPSDDRDGLAAYTYLTGAGYKVDEVHHQRDITTLPASHYDAFQLAVYQNMYGYDSSILLGTGTPFLTVSVMQTDEMGIGSAVNTMHEYRNNFYVIENTHEITSPYPLGLVSFTDSIWTDATEATGQGIVLVVGDALPTPTVTSSPASTTVSTATFTPSFSPTPAFTSTPLPVPAVSCCSIVFVLFLVASGIHVVVRL